MASVAFAEVFQTLSNLEQMISDMKKSAEKEKLENDELKDKVQKVEDELLDKTKNLEEQQKESTELTAELYASEIVKSGMKKEIADWEQKNKELQEEMEKMKEEIRLQREKDDEIIHNIFCKYDETRAFMVAQLVSRAQSDTMNDLELSEPNTPVAKKTSSSPILPLFPGQRKRKREEYHQSTPLIESPFSFPTTPVHLSPCGASPLSAVVGYPSE